VPIRQREHPRAHHHRPARTDDRDRFRKNRLWAVSANGTTLNNKMVSQKTLSIYPDRALAGRQVSEMAGHEHCCG
jgi:hypothetical protein